MHYDYESTAPALFARVENATREIAFSMPAMKSQSSAIVPLFIWINSFTNYYHVAKTVISKRREVQGAASELAEAEK